jgi:hypothetical protein
MNCGLSYFLALSERLLQPFAGLPAHVKPVDTRLIELFHQTFERAEMKTAAVVQRRNDRRDNAMRLKILLDCGAHEG